MQKRHLASVEVRATFFSDQADPAPLLPAHATDTEQLVTQPARAGYLPAAQGALELPAGDLGEQCHRQAVLYHPTLRLQVFLEIDVLEVGAEVLFLVYRSFAGYVSQKPAKGIVGGDAVGLERYCLS